MMNGMWPYDFLLRAGPEVVEVAPPTPGEAVTKDLVHPYMHTPKHSEVCFTTPSAEEQGKLPGSSSTHPVSLA